MNQKKFSLDKEKVKIETVYHWLYFLRICLIFVKELSAETFATLLQLCSLIADI